LRISRDLLREFRKTLVLRQGNQRVAPQIVKEKEGEVEKKDDLDLMKGTARGIGLDQGKNQGKKKFMDDVKKMTVKTITT
jgi:hypothetical protein